jgi:hypothetical protein
MEIFFGLGIFAVLAFVLVAAFIKLKRRDAAYGRGEIDEL